MKEKLTKIKSDLRETIRLADDTTPGPWAIRNGTSIWRFGPRAQPIIALIHR